MSQNPSNILDLIGNTPIVQLDKIPDPSGAKVFAKLEYFNPGGSIKDRIARAIIKDAEKNGTLAPGGTVVEATSGNTGVGLALVAAVKGYKAIFVMPDKVSVEKIKLLKAFGAEVIMTPTAVSPDSPDYYVNTARRVVKENPNALFSDQFFNQVNPQVHYEGTGKEIWEQTNGEITALVAGMGTGGTISGVGEFLKEQNPDVEIIGADPYGSVLKVYHESGVMTEGSPYLVEGIGEDMIPGTLHLKFVDRILNVTDQEAFHMSRKMAREEGIFGGGSAGTIGHVAMQVAAEKPPEDLVLFIVPDTGERYLSKHFSDEWMREQRMLSTDKSTLRVIHDTKSNQLPKLVSVSPKAFVKEALSLINEHGISQLPVLDDNGECVGSLRENQLMAQVLEDRDILEERVYEVMGDPFPILSENLALDSVMKHLREQPAALIEDRGKIVGIVTRFDLIDSTAH
ncbi:MAG: putative cystathionine beta-synthase [Candidatus Marinimicrobia bacterium]|nr:putative cystathionine beta-synthase [Candidatus Neomarinimicrobiota bacterium]